MEEFLCERRATISFRDGNIFRKYYKYSGKEDVLLEQEFSRLAQENGINCPTFLAWDYSNKKNMFYSEFDFEIEPINRHTVTKTVVQEALDQLKRMPYCNDLTIKRDKPYEKDLISVVSYLPIEIHSEYSRLVEWLLSRKSEVMIHGDYSFENIGWDIKNKSVIIFDFQNSGYGVKGWDRAYLLSTIPNFSIASSFLIPDNLIPDNDVIKIITALKYGRAIRKNYEVEERKKIYEYWWK